MNETSVLDYLSFDATGSPDDKNNTMMIHDNEQQRMQGVLWKRRDLFKNHWRPRWFVLHREQNLLTYYLVANNNSHLLVGNRNNNNNNNNRSSNSSSNSTSRRSLPSSPSASQEAEETILSSSSVDYDVVPRGTICLSGSSVERNSVLTNPEENLYVLTITDSQEKNHVYLAARSVSERDKWIQQLNRVCHQQQQSTSTTSSTSSSSPSPKRTLKDLLSPYLSSTTSENLTPQIMDDIREPNNFTLEIQEKVENVLKVIDWEQVTSPESLQQQLSSAMIQTGDIVPVEVLKGIKDIVYTVSSLDESATRKWKTIPDKNLEEKLPQTMIEMMDRLLETYLPYVEQVDHPDLFFKFEKNGIHCSFHKTKNLIRSIRNVEGHGPLDYLQLLWNMERDLELEANVTAQEPLHTYNNNTALLYKAYQAVWPTGPREFCSTAHWRLLQRDNNKSFAVCLLAFSCPEAESFRPNVADKHVRGHLDISLQIWEQTPTGCTHTRIISYDLKGQIPKAIMQSVLTQQGDLPRIMDVHLQKIKKRPTYNTIPDGIQLNSYESIYELLKEQDAITSAEKKKESATMNGRDDDDDDQSIVDESMTTTRTCTSSRSQAPSIVVESIVLLSPVLVHRLIGHALFVFASIVFCVRWVILEHLLLYSILLPCSNKPTMQEASGTTCCNFTVDLKGIKKFLLTKKQDVSKKDKEEPNVDSIHIIVRSVSRVMAKNPGLFARKFPLLPYLYSTDIVLHNQLKAIGKDKQEHARGLWIPTGNNQSIKGVADYCTGPNTSHQQPTLLQRHMLGPSCRLWILPDNTQSDTNHNNNHNQRQIEMEWKMDDCPLNIVISTILQKDGKNRKETKHLGVSMTFQSPDVASCHSFAEQVQELIQSPEMCDE